MNKKLIKVSNALLLTEFKHIFRVMKLTSLFGVLCVSSAFAINVNSQSLRVNIHANQKQAKEVIKQIEEQTDYLFVYNHDKVNLNNTVTIQANNETVAEVLNQMFAGTDIIYAMQGNNILLMQKDAVVQQSGKVVTGTIVDPSGMPVIGANVMVKGTTNGTITDMDGKFSLEVEVGATLQISYIGYANQEIKVGNQKTLSITLKEDSKALEELVVVGYGTMKKSDLTGAVANVDQENIKNISTATIDQKLVGQIAGVQIQQVSGAPGSGTSIKIRGAGSIGAGNDPLYVVDGMPYSSGFDQNMNPLNFISPNDIESITVLKDASSTAIYGSRGANGVIMITTKRGEFDKTDVAVSSRFGFQQVPQKGRPDMMNQYEFADLQRERIGIAVRKLENRDATSADYPSEYLPENLKGEGTNWYDLILQTALTQEYNISVNKGSKESRLNFSLGYYNQEGVLKYTGLERFSGKLTMESNIGNFKIGASLQPTFIIQDRTNVASSREDVIAVATWANPVMKPYDDNGNLIPYIYSPQSKYHTAWGFVNPLFLLRETIQKHKNFQNLGTAFIEWNILDGLVAKSSLNTNYSSTNYFNYIPSTVGAANKPPTEGSGISYNSRGNSFNWLIENTISYNKVFSDKHSLNALVGYTAQNSRSDEISLTASPYPDDLIKTINAAQDINNWGQSIEEWSMISYLSRVNYVYDNKYLFTATLRSDGSSRFGAENRYATFPSFAAAWRVSEEAFLKGNKTISNLKTRLSWGKSGNNNIGNYAHLASINAGDYIFDTNQVTASNIGVSNPWLTWEESSQIDAGVDLGLFNNRLSIVLDYYYKKSVNMLLSDRIPAITGFTSQTVNKGNVRNTGFELSINAIPFDGDFHWDFGFNLSLNRNKVLSINGNDNTKLYSGIVDEAYSNVTMVGEPIGQLIGYIFDGYYTKEDLSDPNVVKYPTACEGAVKYKDLNGDGTISSPLDFDIIGNPFPNFIYGMTNNFAYKNFDLSIVINGQYGGEIINALRSVTDNIQGFFNVTSDWVNRWRSEDNPGDGKHYGIPLSTPWYGHKINSNWIEDASYLRISNLSLGYTLPSNILNGMKFVKNCRFYLSMQNLATFTKYSGNNPEAKQSGNSNTLASGVDMSSYPLARTVSIGLNINF